MSAPLIMAGIVIVLVCATMPARAQVDDLADDPWSVPQLDALQTFRDDPICLRCAKPSTLTVLPGIGRTTASRICAAVAAGQPTVEAVADSACLSVDQRMILLNATTLRCTCTSWFRSAKVQTRSAISALGPPDQQARVDFSAEHLRVGAVTRTGSSGTILGGWAAMDLGIATVVLGDIAVQAGLGLVLGGGGGFGRGPVSKARSANTTLSMRPWTSTWQDQSQRGVGVRVADTIGTVPFQAGGYWSQRTVNSRLETTTAAAVVGSVHNLSVGLAAQHLQYSSASESLSMFVMPQLRRTLASAFAELHDRSWEVHAEVAMDDSARPAASVVAQHEFSAGRVVGAARWAHASVRNPYAAPISSASGLGNEAGLVIGLQLRTHGWRIEASADVHQRLSRSYGSPLPSKGVDLLVDVERSLGRRITFAARGRYEVDDEGWRETSGAMPRMIRRYRTTARAEVAAYPVRDIRLRVRADVRHLEFDRWRGPELGTLLYADAAWEAGSALTLTARYTVFNAASIDVAPYTLEAPLQGYLRTVAGSGIGSRSFLAARFSPTSWVGISAVVAHEQRIPKPGYTTAAVQLDVLLRGRGSKK